MFLNLIFNNIVRDDREYIENMWLRQFKVNLEDPHANKFCKKQVTRVTDFSITMKKNIWLTEDLYFCNKEYIKSGVSYAPSQTDLVMLDPYIYGILHNDIEKESTGVPLFAKLIDRQQYYTPWCILLAANFLLWNTVRRAPLIGEIRWCVWGECQLDHPTELLLLRQGRSPCRAWMANGRSVQLFGGRLVQALSHTCPSENSSCGSCFVRGVYARVTQWAFLLTTPPSWKVLSRIRTPMIRSET